MNIQQGPALPLTEINQMTPLEAALTYRAHGYQVLPWAPDAEGRKHPLVVGWNSAGWNPQESVIRDWFTRWPAAGVGLITNRHSGLIAVDVDVIEHRQRAEADHGQWNITLTQRSGRGGGAHHALYNWPGESEVKQGKLHGTDYPGVDIKSNGFIGVAPSVHPNGAKYEWDTSMPAEPQAVGLYLRQLLIQRQEQRWHAPPVTSDRAGGHGGARPDVDGLLRLGIRHGGHDDTLKDVVWYGVLDGQGDEQLWLTWSAIVHRTVTDPSRPFTRVDFERHLASARAKLDGYRPMPLEQFHWDWVNWVTDHSLGRDVDPAGEDAPVAPEGPDEQRYEQLIELAAVKSYINIKGRTLAEARIIAENLPPFEDVGLAELLDQAPTGWVLPGVLPVGVVGLAGPPEAGKSLLVRDWLDAVANGTRWRRWRTEQPRQVTYVVGEGRGGIPTRFSGVRTENIRVCTPVALSVEAEVERFIESRRDTNTGLVVFDMIYHMGVVDEDKSTAMLPLLAASRRISEELACCVLLIGHPGHNGERRFRGSSALRGYFDAEYHLAENTFSCEKMKDGDTKEQLRGTYQVDYPHLRWTTVEELMANAATEHLTRQARIAQYLADNPGVSGRQAGRDLAEELGVTTRHVERMVSEAREQGEDPSDT